MRPPGTSATWHGCWQMEKNDQTNDPQLRELLSIEVADIVATANEQGFPTKDVLLGLSSAVEEALEALAEDPDPADDPPTPPADPHPAADFGST